VENQGTYLDSERVFAIIRAARRRVLFANCPAHTKVGLPPVTKQKVWQEWREEEEGGTSSVLTLMAFLADSLYR